MRTLTISIACLLIITSGLFKWFSYQEVKSQNQQAKAATKEAAKLLKNSQSSVALALLIQNTPHINGKVKINKKWAELVYQAYIDSLDHSQIASLYEKNPKIIKINEYISLAAAQSLLENDRLDEYAQLRNEWKGKAKEPSKWFFLDVKELQKNGKTDEEIQLLSSHVLSGDEETDRLVQLAAIHFKDSPELAEKYLSEASMKDPNNADLHIYKANFYESMEKNKQALYEYTSAVQQDPKNSFYQEQLADFYIRHRKYPQAFSVLQDSLTPDSTDEIWLKGIFWNKIVKPLNHTVNIDDIPQGKLHPLVVYITSLPSGIFWNPRAFTRLHDNISFLNHQQETYWLMLLHTLKSGQEKDALEILELNPFASQSWAPEIEESLKAILTYRQLHEENPFIIPQSSNHSSPIPHKSHDFLSTLSAISTLPPEQLHAFISPELSECILSNQAFALPFLAYGWNEAALQLHHQRIIPQAFPQWVALDITQALIENRNKHIALEFALDQHPSPPLALLTAELALTENRKDIAFNYLQKLYQRKDHIGQKATLLIAPLFIEKENPKAARDAINFHPELAQLLEAREILARASLLEQDHDIAHSLYTEMEHQSTEAKSFLAHKAFMEKDWNRARQLTEDLLKVYPNNMILQENLKKISIEENRWDSK